MSNEPMPYTAGAVPVPNRLFDEILPRLSDTELRVYLIVLRQTVGFREGSDTGGWRYKERDWITHTQLVQKTGRGGDAVSRAIKGLVEAGLIVVEDQQGALLSTAQQRRRHLGRLYFRPDMWITRISSHPVKPEITTYNLNNIKNKVIHNWGKRYNTRRASTGSGWQRAVPASRNPRSASSSGESNNGTA